MSTGSVIELQEIESSLIHHFVAENNCKGLKEFLLQSQSNIDIRNEVFISKVAS